MRPTIHIVLIATALGGLVRPARADPVTEWIDRAMVRRHDSPTHATMRRPL